MKELVSARIESDTIVGSHIKWTKLFDRCRRDVKRIIHVILIAERSMNDRRRQPVDCITDVIWIRTCDRAVDRPRLIDAHVDFARLLDDTRPN